MDFNFTPEQDMLRESVRRMLDKVATPDYVRRTDAEGRYPYELYQSFADLGLIAMAFPAEYGGADGGVMDFVIVAEEIGRTSYDFMCAYATTVFNGLNLLRHGSEAQKRHYLPRLISGELRMSIAMTEPDAGSDAGRMRTTARREGDQWVISGQKVFSSAAGADNNIISLYAKTSPEAHYKKGISLFLVDNTTPGVKLNKLDMLGRRCTGTYEIFFDEARIPAECLVGEVDHGWTYMLSGLQLERLMTAAGYSGASQSVVAQAAAYAHERRQFGKPIGNFQAIAHMLADMKTEVEASRLLMLHAAWQLAAGRDALQALSMAKLHGSETYVKVANMGMQIMGGYGYNNAFDMQRHFRESRSTTIAAGTSQIQRNIIAQGMGFDPR